MALSRPCIARLVVASLLLIPASLAHAGSLSPNPANGTSPATYGWGSVSLNPNPALYESQCTWLYAAATNAAEPYNKVANNPWAFQYNAGFNGTFTIAGFKPAGGFDPEDNNGNYQANITGMGTKPTFGGASFDIGLTGFAGPAVSALTTATLGTNLEWMQVVLVNQAGWNYIRSVFPQAQYFVQGNGLNGVPAGSYAFLDNAGNTGLGGAVAPGSTPWYGWGSATIPGGNISTSVYANTNGLLDTPNLRYVAGMSVQFQSFLVSDNITNNAMGGVTNTVTIEGGVWWGFQDAVPEPSSWILMISGCGILAFARRRALLDRLFPAA